MKRPDKRWLTVGWIAIAAAALAAGPAAMSVQVKNGQVRATPSFLGQLIAPVSYGDRLPVLEQQGDWSKVTLSGGQTGWIHNSALSKKKIVMKAGGETADAGVSGEEVAHAGKGFNAQVEADFKSKNQNIDFSWVDKMEQIKVTPEAIQQFLKEGGIQPNEGGKP
ncbi:MAG TPA: SH3 domain-containing protein [Candidatus Paceibacterota bacterium]|nr:SH3 domain-containing protein [Verrucomicrobiota bacterium]HRY50605.1 SH3 domain-containing protein [Candidatus Paceibacterota bacterium]HRZ99537.1 SH3 domain-containing protein [Candidatus Paceibacterota bacterium]